MSMDAIDGLASALGFGAGWGAKALARQVGAGADKRRVATPSEPVRRALEQAGHEALLAPVLSGRVQLDDAAAEALCASGLPEDDTAVALVAEYARVVAAGGQVLVATAAGLARRGPERHRVCAAFLHAGLVGIEQRLSRGTVITSGHVRR